DGSPTEVSIRRTVRAAQLYHEGRAPLLLFSTGGTTYAHLSEAAAMARFARSLGVPPKAILLEEKSRNTEENARFTAALLRERGIARILLVTDPIHMRRARDSFRAQGIGVDIAPTTKIRRLGSRVGGWNLFVKGMHEYIGIAFYRLRGFLGF
ncbi:MAG: YdcF family protein, partial [bacterium]